MPPPVSELELVLRQLIDEHRRLLACVEVHEAAVKTLDARAIQEAGRHQEAARLRIVAIEQRRRGIVQQLMRGGAPGAISLRKIAEAYPARAQALMQLRAELKTVIEQITRRTHVAGRVASAILGHLNTMVRLVTGAVERAGLYTKRGIPRASTRIGLMDAKG